MADVFGRKTKRVAWTEMANHPAAGKAAITSGFAVEHRCPGLPEPGR